jgi:hypothetical protein
MHHTNHSRKIMENEIVEYRHENFLFMITRFQRINWKEYKGFAQYQYFFYVFDKSLKTAGQQCSNTDVLNTIVIENMYPTFENLIQNLDAILCEYILVDDAIFDCLKQVEKLNPIYVDKE